jgi:hypothetical protein
VSRIVRPSEPNQFFELLPIVANLFKKRNAKFVQPIRLLLMNDRLALQLLDGIETHGGDLLQAAAIIQEGKIKKQRREVKENRA